MPKELALYPLKFEFFGTNAHACQPQNSHSALDAAVMSYMGISLLRQYTKANTYIHGIIRDGGRARPMSFPLMRQWNIISAGNLWLM